MSSKKGVVNLAVNLALFLRVENISALSVVKATTMNFTWNKPPAKDCRQSFVSGVWVTKLSEEGLSMPQLSKSGVLWYNT
jgi:hypothetical protein